MSNKNPKIFSGIAVISLGFDIFSKYLAHNFLPEKIKILGDFFFLQHIKNTGIAFSIQLPFLKIITIVLIIAITYFFIHELRKKDISYATLKSSAFGLILGGAIGNAVERILFGQVTDFIGIQYFAIFNLADSFIFIGVCLYLYAESRKK